MKKTHDAKDVTESRKEALQKAISLIEEGNLKEKFSDKNGSYYSKDKFIVTWLSNKKGYAGETSLDLTDNFYSDISGYQCILCNRGLFHENQIDGFGSIERGLLDVIMRLDAFLRLLFMYILFIFYIWQKRILHIRLKKK